ncbi:integrator complex subunit 14-like [Ruditapes philippinarum]|uniref:integrator complex subunit 14-like n=1 Tax=Ruditapes philippinarum TaxID=129788 RepID=UPI00295C3440|nr:integrator complex subunit 14-like [Ruditapes philippinarum]XP_060558632.1 integrator complex subunit 14-like [Ruditapes philippinarum]
MPTVLALDVSLSMCRPVKGETALEEYSRKNLAIHGLSSLIDQFSKLEFTSLIVFSYLWEQLVPFTRDVDTVKTALNTVGDYSKTCLEPFLTGISGLVVEEFGGTTSVQVILVTDGSTGVGTGSLSSLIDLWTQSNEGDSTVKCPLPFAFKGKLIIVCIANPTAPEMKKSIPLYEKLIELNGDGELFIPDGPLSMTVVQDMFKKIAEKYYTPYTGLLTCGHLECNITLYPSPEPFNKESEFVSVHTTVSEKLEICGFMDLQDIASPPTVSRHLVLPVTNKQKQNSAESSGEKGKEDEDETEDGKQPSFTVLLHGSLKVEGMVAVTRVAENWFGILYSWADSKKKSSLMLSLFEPGADSVSWLGNLNYLAPITDFSEPPYGDDDNRTPFPVRPKEKRSYAQSCVVWIKAAGLQADLQKVIRHARKLPDKQQQFYKELNRVRKAALSFGFNELLEAMAGMLERECTMLPGTAHPDAALQLTHAATKLRSDDAKQASQLIMPLRTNFSQDDG